MPYLEFSVLQAATSKVLQTAIKSLFRPDSNLLIRKRIYLIMGNCTTLPPSTGELQGREVLPREGDGREH